MLSRISCALRAAAPQFTHTFYGSPHRKRLEQIHKTPEARSVFSASEEGEKITRFGSDHGTLVTIESITHHTRFNQ